MELLSYGTIFLHHTFRQSLLKKATAAVLDNHFYNSGSVMMHLSANLRLRQTSSCQ